MPDPAKYGLPEWGLIGFVVVVLLTAVGVLFRTLQKERRAFQLTVKEVTLTHTETVDKLTLTHKETIDKLVTDHRVEMLALIERDRTASDNQVEKYHTLAERMVDVLATFSKRLDKRPRGGPA